MGAYGGRGGGRGGVAEIQRLEDKKGNSETRKRREIKGRGGGGGGSVDTGCRLSQLPLASRCQSLSGTPLQWVLPRPAHVLSARFLFLPARLVWTCSIDGERKKKAHTQKKKHMYERENCVPFSVPMKRDTGQVSAFV